MHMHVYGYICMCMVTYACVWLHMHVYGYICNDYKEIYVLNSCKSFLYGHLLLKFMDANNLAADCLISLNYNMF